MKLSSLLPLVTTMPWRLIGGRRRACQTFTVKSADSPTIFDTVEDHDTVNAQANALYAAHAATVLPGLYDLIKSMRECNANGNSEPDVMAASLDTIQPLLFQALELIENVQPAVDHVGDGGVELPMNTGEILARTASDPEI